MTLYQEIPKQSLLTELHKRHTPDELSIVQPELNRLLLSCRSLDELSAKVRQIVHTKHAPVVTATSHVSHTDHS